MCYRQGFSTQHPLIKSIKSWRQSLDSRGYRGAVLMDLSKAFDTINHELLIAKLRAYGFNKESLELILDYLFNGWQRTKICDNFSKGCLHPHTEDICSLHQDCISLSYTYYWSCIVFNCPTFSNMSIYVSSSSLNSSGHNSQPLKKILTQP